MASKQFDLSTYRNIGIVAHVDAGKTTITERLLFYGGASHKIGEVHDGQAHMDYLEEERAHGITITAAATRLDWRGYTLQLLDTPGHVDFTIEVERSMRVLDGCVVVLDGVRGVEPQTETVWRQRSKFNLPAIFFINKLDRPGADFDQALVSIRKRLAAEPVPITVPAGDDGVVHLIERTLLRFGGEQGETVASEPCPEGLWQTLAGHRESLLLAAAEFDEALAELVLDDGEPEQAMLCAALRKGTLAGRIFPVYAGSALRNRGIQPILDGIVDYLPAPTETPPASATTPQGEAVELSISPKEPLVALAFKVQLWDGRRHVFARIYRGTLNAGDKVAFINNEGKVREEHAARLFEVDAGKRKRIDSAQPGQIVLIAGLRFAATGDTLCQPGQLLLLERIDARAPVLALAIEPASNEEEEKMLEVLDKLQQEDPTLRMEEDEETGQRLLKGMGELHLKMVLERLEREFQLHIRAGQPRVALRETLGRPCSADSIIDREVEINRKPVALKARLRLGLEPLARGSGNTVSLEPKVLPEGASLNPDQRAALEKGAQELLHSGPLEGAPLEDVALTLQEIELFGPASTPDALRSALFKAAHQALEAGEVQLLRPIMLLETVVPSENIGSVLGDLQSRQAVILATDTQEESGTVRCEAALDKLLGYATELRGMTRGLGQFSMEFLRFDH
jgi:elongation factor G